MKAMDEFSILNLSMMGSCSQYTQNTLIKHHKVGVYYQGIYFLAESTIG